MNETLSRQVVFNLDRIQSQCMDIQSSIEHSMTEAELLDQISSLRKNTDELHNLVRQVFNQINSINESPYKDRGRPMIQTEHLIKKLDGRFVSQDISLTVHKGEIFGLVGPEGSGNTILIEMLLGVVPPTAGKITLAGQTDNLYEIRRRIGVCTDSPAFFGHMTVWQNLKYHILLNGLKVSDGEIRDILNNVGLPGREKNKVKTLSDAQMRLLGIACAIAGKPEILILDEPLHKLSPGQTEIIEKLLRDQRESGTAILITAQHQEEIEHVADTLGFLSKGKLTQVIPGASLRSGTGGAI